MMLHNITLSIVASRRGATMNPLPFSTLDFRQQCRTSSATLLSKDVIVDILSDNYIG